MSTMKEKCARAIFEAVSSHCANQMSEHDRECAAHAILQVLREPSERMIAAGFEIHPCEPGHSKVSDAYRAMIDAILTEESSE